MRRNEPSLEEGLEDYYYDLFMGQFDECMDYGDLSYAWFDEENWLWWLEQVDYDAVNEVLGEDYYY